MREIVDVSASFISVQPGLICLAKHVLPIVESVFGEQGVVKESPTAVCLDAIKSRRPFQVLVWYGEPVRVEGAVLQSDGKSWVVDVPDMSEFISSADDVLKAIALLALSEGVPLKTVYRTYVARITPEGVQNVYRGWMDGVLSMKYGGEETYYVKGFSEMSVLPELVL